MIQSLVLAPAAESCGLADVGLLDRRFEGRIDPEPAACEAPNLRKRTGQEKWVLMFDRYGIQPHNFGFCETSELKSWTHLGRFDEGVAKATNFRSPKHGLVIHPTKAEAGCLARCWKLQRY
jgi:hypothetical protein